MRVHTYGKVSFGKSDASVSKSDIEGHMIISFTSSDHLQNAAHVHMTLSEAKRFAMQLIAYAEKMEPSEDI